MNIGIYLQTWHVGGVATFCERLAEGFKAANHKPLVLLATPFGKRDAPGRTSYLALIRRGSFPVHCLHLNAFHPKERSWRAADQIAALGCDLIFLSAHQAILGALRFLVPQTALVGIAHTDDAQSYAEFEAAEAWCDAYIGVSRAISEELRRVSKKLSPAAVHHIASGVPCPRREYGPPTGQPRILVVSRLVQQQKRVLDLPQVWHSYRRQGGQGTLTICGSGPEEERLREEFGNELRSGGVVLTGAVPAERLAEIYAQNDILLSLSAYEGLPLAVMEAAMAGVYPLLSSTRSGHPEIVAALGEGRLCQPEDTEAFASALGEVCSKLDQIRQLRPVLQERACAHFALEPMLHAYVKLATQLITERRSRQGPAGSALDTMPRPRVDFARRWLRRWQYRRHYGRDKS